jgi:hypothetical protein
MEALEWRKTSCCWQELNKLHWVLLKDGSIRTQGFVAEILQQLLYEY